MTTLMERGNPQVPSKLLSIVFHNSNLEDLLHLAEAFNLFFTVYITCNNGPSADNFISSICESLSNIKSHQPKNFTRNANMDLSHRTDPAALSPALLRFVGSDIHVLLPYLPNFSTKCSCHPSREENSIIMQFLHNGSLV